MIEPKWFIFLVIVTFCWITLNEWRCKGDILNRDYRTIVGYVLFSSAVIGCGSLCAIL